nr:MAG TPA: hypothetical protein [Caudoviricetes sp.]
MTISELIAELEKIKAKHGDIEVEYTYNDDGYILSGSESVDEVYVETDGVTEKKIVVLY